MVDYANSANASDIINRVAAEVGLTPVSDPYSTSNAAFTQLTYLLNIAGDELAVFHDWNILRKEHTFTTALNDTGNYALPSDFRRLIDRTLWDRTNDEPLIGPLSPQEWSALLGRDTPSVSNMSFRLTNGEFFIYPHDPVGVVRDIAFEYVSNQWVVDVGGTEYSDNVTTGSEFPMFDRVLIGRYIKLKFLLAKGINATSAQDDFNQIFERLTSQEKGGRILNAGRANGAFPFINPVDNIGNTGYGS